ncbi:MAG: bifunctional (p)ppGpp synthetase/guanosine-3',5'-bis(diphosphate) 3'-pyrophosphohydrolase [Aquincola sp.]|nr:bifunctional (p)ppGpp synthetase/guanosine-3',5'-bis(diphosphate) 3'-pyrophosphohydrolase [Aquincola sp.]
MVDLASGAPSDAGHLALQRARAFAEPLLAGHALDTGEDAMAHADGVAAILAGIGAAPAMQAAAYLVYAGDWLQRPDEVVAKAFGPSYASLVGHTRRLVQIQRAARSATASGDAAVQAEQTERVRKMLLAFSHDLRVVLLRLASRLQTLRWHAAARIDCPQDVARESRDVFAPLANRLGIWQIKWELEDQAFRFLQPGDYRRVAKELDETRSARESAVQALRRQVAALLASHGLKAEVQGRPKHLYSIWKKMQGKRLSFDAVFDLLALRVIVADVDACYAALARLHERWPPIGEEFDDYIAKPKPNGYQSLHTVVRGDDGRAVEIQIRTRAMHEHAEYGVAAHWAYKEAGTKGYAGVSATGSDEERIAAARKAVLRQLLAWERDFSSAEVAGATSRDDRIYVFTPQATVIELPAGGTPVDFAYMLHTDLGHRCRGAKVDGVLVPLNTPLANGQTVEITSAKEGGPSLDWLNPDLGYLAGARARAKVRAWFNAQAMAQTVARGRDLVEKLLQREGKTALERDELAAQLGFKNADALYEVVGKDEFSLRHIEQLLRPAAPAPADEAAPLIKRSRADGTSRGAVLVVGVDSLLTSLARCCRPAPPDEIDGFVTRGKGVAIHRRGCSNLRHMRERAPDRVIAVEWGRSRNEAALYPIDVLVEAADRPALLRDITEVFAKEKINVTGAHSQSARGSAGATAWMTFTVEVSNSERLAAVLKLVAQVSGVRTARRK